MHQSCRPKRLDSIAQKVQSASREDIWVVLQNVLKSWLKTPLVEPIWVA